MSMTDSAVFRNVKTQETVSVAVATNSIGMPRDGVILDAKLKTVAKDSAMRLFVPRVRRLR